MALAQNGWKEVAADPRNAGTTIVKADKDLRARGLARVARTKEESLSDATAVIHASETLELMIYRKFGAEGVRFVINIRILLVKISCLAIHRASLVHNVYHLFPVPSR